MNDHSPIPLARPCVGAEELEQLREVLESRTLARGPKVAEFERLVAECVGVEHAIATTSATTALHLALVALDIGPGDEVLVPDFTFPATANVVVQQGATPVLVDIELDSFTMALDDLEARITPRSKAIMPVHAFGRAANMPGIMAIAERHGLFVIEDAACALGTKSAGRPCGSIGHVGCFSFHPRKTITTGEGGMVTTNDSRLADRMRLLRNHGGRRVDGRFIFEAAGFNYWMSDLQAAVGIAQMGRLEELNERRRTLSRDYARYLHNVAGVSLPQTPSIEEHIFQSYVVLLDAAHPRDRIIEAMRAVGIETTLGTYALSCQPFFQQLCGSTLGGMTRSRTAFEHTLTLPMFRELSSIDLRRVTQALLNALNGAATLERQDAA